MQLDRLIKPHMRPRVPLYVAGYIATIMAFRALSIISTDSTFVHLLLLLLTLGFIVSWAVRSELLSRSAMTTIALALLIPALIAVFKMPAFRYQIFPPEMTRSSDQILPVLLAWVTVLHSFNLSTDKAVAFLCVPCISIIGIATTMSPDTDSMACFAAFLLISVFLLIQQNILSYQEPEAGTIYVGLRTYPARSYLPVAIAVAVAALAFGMVAGKIIYPALDNAFLSQMVTRNTQRIISQFPEENYVPVATGPVRLSDQVVMIVRCREPLLWRGQTFDRYTGSGWSSSFGPRIEQLIYPANMVPHDKFTDHRPRRPPTLSRTFEIPDDLYQGSRSNTRPIKQIFGLMDGRFDTIFAAADPRVVSCHTTGPLLKSASTLRAALPYNSGAMYTVVSEVSTATPKQLREASRKYSEFISRNYLELPESCWRSEGLARRITAGSRNPWDKACAIQKYLEEHYMYDTNAPAAPRHEDAVSHFLFKSRRGYCDIFASAMVIISREVGIPARWVTGFAAGEPIQTGSAYHVRMKDRHAWAELYFPNYGWITFDPTPSTDKQSSLSGLRRLGLSIRRNLPYDKLSLFLMSLILALGLYLFKTEILGKRHSYRSMVETQTGRIAPPKTTANYARMCDLLSRFGYPRHPSTTPEEYASYLRKIFSSATESAAVAVDTITANFVESRYSTHELPSERINASADALSLLTSSLKTAKRRKLLPQHQV